MRVFDGTKATAFEGVKITNFFFSLILKEATIFSKSSWTIGVIIFIPHHSSSVLIILILRRPWFNNGLVLTFGAAGWRETTSWPIKSEFCAWGWYNPQYHAQQCWTDKHISDQVCRILNWHPWVRAPQGGCIRPQSVARTALFSFQRAQWSSLKAYSPIWVGEVHNYLVEKKTHVDDFWYLDGELGLWI